MIIAWKVVYKVSKCCPNYEWPSYLLHFAYGYLQWYLNRCSVSTFLLVKGLKGPQLLCNSS